MSPRHTRHETNRQKLKVGQFDGPEALSMSPETLSASPETLSTSPETLSASSETLSASSETLSASSETLSASPETLSTSPESLSVPPAVADTNSTHAADQVLGEFRAFTGTIDLITAAQTFLRTDDQIRRLKDFSSMHESRKNSAPPPEQMQLGEDYEVLELLGQGGMGFVYKVKDKRKNQVVAVKVVRPELATDPRALRRFEQEAEAAMGLLHPNLVPVYAQGVTADGAPYLVMEYQEGTPLDVVLREENTINSERAVDIFMQICDALDHAHAKGLVHRDLKPSNIVLTKTKNSKDLVRIVDFGIAKVLASPESRESLALTHTGDLFGSPSYMSPEQCMGYRLDARSDIYSLGCVMYQVLSGQPPFICDNPVQTIVKHLSEIPERLNRSQGGSTNITAGLEVLVLRCLEKDPRNRYQSMEQLRQDLSHIQTGGKPIYYARAREHVGKQWPFMIQIAAMIIIDIFCLSAAFGKHEQAIQTLTDAHSVITQTDSIKRLFHEAVNDLRYYNLSKSSYFLDRYTDSMSQIPIEFWRLYSYNNNDVAYKHSIMVLDTTLQNGLSALESAKSVSETSMLRSEGEDGKKENSNKTIYSDIINWQQCETTLININYGVDERLRKVAVEAYRTIASDPVNSSRYWLTAEVLLLILANMLVVINLGKSVAEATKKQLWHDSNTRQQ